MNVLGINAVFHDPAAAVVSGGRIVAAAEEERFSRRKHGKSPVPFSTWELPEQAMAFCLAEAGLEPGDLDAIAYSYDPALAMPPGDDITDAEWEGLRTLYARRAPRFLATALPGLDPERVRWVPHHIAHAASATYASGFDPCSVLVLDGRGERASHLAGRHRAVVAGRTNLLELAAIVGAAGRVVSGDTGVAHLATALGVASVVLFGPTPPAEWGPPPDRTRHRALWAGRRGDPHGAAPDPGLLAIEVDDVLAALRQPHTGVAAPLPALLSSRLR